MTCTMAVGRENQVMLAEEETLHTPLLSLGLYTRHLGKSLPWFSRPTWESVHTWWCNDGKVWCPPEVVMNLWNGMNPIERR